MTLMKCRKNRMNILIKPNKLDDLDIGRTVGGIAWPGEKSGYAVVVGEEDIPRRGGKVRHFHVLAEVEEWNKVNLIKACIELQGLYKTMGFYGRRDHQSMFTLLSVNSVARERRETELDFQPAPLSEQGRIEYHIDILRKRLDHASKSLYMNHGNIALKLDIPNEEYGTALDTKYPAVAALGYAIATLETYEPEDDEEDRETSSALNLNRSWVTGY
jgi:hypothetical protein